MNENKHTPQPSAREIMAEHQINSLVVDTNIPTADLRQDHATNADALSPAPIEAAPGNEIKFGNAYERPDNIIPWRFARAARRLGALAAVGLSLGAAAPAAAVELRLDGKPGRVEPYQTYDETSKMPTPHKGIVNLKFAAHPRQPDARGVIDFGTPSTMYLKPMAKVDLNGESSMRMIFDHEIGHEADHKSMTTGERATFNRLRGSKNPGWRIGVSDPTPQEVQDYETFAENRAICARWPKLDFNRYMHGYGDRESVFLPPMSESRRGIKQHERICKFIKRATNPNLSEQIYTPEVTVVAKKVGGGRGTIKIADKTCPPKVRKCINREVDSNEPATVAVRAARGSKVVGLVKGGAAVAARRSASRRNKSTQYYEIPVQSLREASAAGKKPALKLKITKK